MSIISLNEYELYPLDKSKPEDKKFLLSIKDAESKTFSITYLIKEDLKTKSDKANVYIIKKQGIPIGYIAISQASDKGEVSIRYAIHEKYRGAHHGRNIIRLLSDYLLEHRNVNSISALVDADNFASRKVLSYAGFKIIEEFDITNSIGYGKSR